MRNASQTSSAMAIFLAATSGTLASDTSPLQLMCEGAEVTSAGESVNQSVNQLRFRVEIDRKPMKDQNLSLNKFRKGYKNAEAEHVFEPIMHSGEVWITYCNQAGWPKECDVQRPAQRDLMVSQMSEPGDPVFVSGYVSCAFCPLSVFNIVTEGPEDIRFQMFEFDLVKGHCKAIDQG